MTHYQFQMWASPVRGGTTDNVNAGESLRFMLAAIADVEPLLQATIERVEKRNGRLMDNQPILSVSMHSNTTDSFVDVYILGQCQNRLSYSDYLKRNQP